MSRTLSTAALEAISAQETGQVFLVLMTIDHDDLSTPIRLVNNNEDVTSQGNDFIAFPFEIALPADSANSISHLTMKVDNVDRRIVDSIRSVTTPPSVAIEVIMASSPDTVEAGPFNMTMETAEYDAITVTAQIVFEDVLNESFPGDKFLISGFPGLF